MRLAPVTDLEEALLLSGAGLLKFQWINDGVQVVDDAIAEYIPKWFEAELEESFKSAIALRGWPYCVILEE